MSNKTLNVQAYLSLPNDRAREEMLRDFAQGISALPNGEIKALDAQISALETKHGIKSETMRSQIESGERPETSEICDWLMLLHERDCISAHVKN